MLVVALIEKHQVAGPRLRDIAADQMTVELDQLDRVDVRPDLAAALLPLLGKTALGVAQLQFRRQVTIGQAIAAQPFVVMDFQRFIGGEAHQPGAILLIPARARALAQLLLGDAHEPGAEHLGLLRVERWRLDGLGTCAQQQRHQAETADQCRHSAFHSSGSHCQWPSGSLPSGKVRAYLP
ncbi:hypothetical protein D3C72_1630950 [compost metagenome]